MAQVDSLLKMLRSQQGDLLRITRGSPPEFTKNGSPVRLFFPTVSEGMHDRLILALLTPSQSRAVIQKQLVSFVYDAGELGTYDVDMSGGLRGLTSFRFRRGSGATPVSVTRDTVVPQQQTADLDMLLARAIEAKASDVHLSTGTTPVIRVDGRLHRLGQSVSIDEALASWLTPEQQNRVQGGQSVDVGIDYHDSRLRINVYRHFGGTAVAVRILPASAPKLISLQLPSEAMALSAIGQGLVLVAGPTGSGKSTTVAAMAQERLRIKGGLLITLEDPIEFTISGGRHGLVRQRQIGRDVRNYPTGLRDALREDPDVLVVGEMRDPETIALALTAAETGHLVYATLHSRSAGTSVERIVDTYPASRQSQVRAQLALSLQGVICQQLVPRASGKGRVPIVEVLRSTNAVQNVIREGHTAKITNVIDLGRADGMVSMQTAIAAAVANGTINPESALKPTR
ncbi:MAG: twitching motility protein PilT [Myxococcota bacterium]